MSTPHVTDAELEAFLDEALPHERMAALESQLRADGELLARLGQLRSLLDAGGLSLGGLWRRERLTCPTREQLGAYLLQAMAAERRNYVTFHLEELGCRHCTANLADLQRQVGNAEPAAETRRRRYFESSAGALRRR